MAFSLFLSSFQIYNKPMAYDIVIKSGTVFDGSGKPGVQTDIGIKGDEITAIGNLDGAAAAKTIDATGKYVTPGFIDTTNHSDTHLTLFKYPNLESLVMQGITTVIGGNCGTSLAPLAKPEAIQAASKWVDLSEININWARVSEFLEQLRVLRPAVNFGTLVGYGTLRRGIIDNQIRLLNPEEIEKTKFLLTQALQDGAFGLSLGLAYGHERVSTTEEIIKVVRPLQEEGGVIKIHLRSEGSDLVGSVNEVVRIARETGIPVQISHLKAIGKKSWPSLRKALELIETANSTGTKVTFDVAPYNTTGSPLYLLIPNWARFGGFLELFQRIDDPEQKKKIIEDLKMSTLHYDRIFIISAKTKTIVGHTLAQVAQEGGITPEEALVDTVRANDGHVTIVGRTLSSQNTELAIKNKYSCIATDGSGFSQEVASTGDLVHPRCFGAFPHFWHRYVRDHKILTPEEAVAKMTGKPATKFSLEKRGFLQKGNFADVVVFDPQIMQDRATYRNPFPFPSGIDWVLINGSVSVEEGRCLSNRVGRILTRK